jgi:hypothetical protein
MPRGNKNVAPGRTIGRLVREYVKQHGPSASYEACRDHLCQAGLPLKEKTFIKNYNFAIHPETYRHNDTSKRKVTQEPVMDALKLIAKDKTQYLSSEEVTASANDRLSSFIRFAMAVEAAGGIDRARTYLDMMEKLGSAI